jgi:hypothetical protein
MTLIVLTYLEYLVIGIAVTAWVAEAFARSGRVLLVDARPSQAALAQSRIHLMKVGFYLLGLGYISRKLMIDGPRPGQGYEISGVRLSMDILADKIGRTLLVLGMLLLCHVYALQRMRRRELLAGHRPPGAPAPARRAAVAR